MLALDRVKVAAFQALERNVARLGLEAGMIAAIIEHPEPKKERRDKEAVNDGGGGDIHDGVLAEENAACRENRRGHFFTMSLVHIEDTR